LAGPVWNPPATRSRSEVSPPWPGP
jgi:hypothetical protein